MVGTLGILKKVEVMCKTRDCVNQDRDPSNASRETGTNNNAKQERETWESRRKNFYNQLVLDNVPVI